MPKSAAQIAEILGAHREAMRSEFMRLSLLQRRIEGKLTRTWMPKNADAEYRDLFEKAKGPWLEFTRDAIAQGIRIDGCNSDAIWTAWQKNGMDGRQNGVTRQAVGLGKSYLLVIPSSKVVTDELEDGTIVTREERDPDGPPVIRPLSSLSTFAYFSDPWNEFPDWTLTRVGPTKIGNYWQSKWIFIDDEALYRFTGDVSGFDGATLRVFEHGLDVTPVALVSNTLPTEGEPESSVERAIPIYKRIVDGTFALEMAQRYTSFPQKWASGGTIAPGVNVSADSMLHNTDPEGKFGSFAVSNLSDVVAAVDAHIKHLAAVCQVPPHYLLGAVVNMSAEGIAAAESGYFRNIGERQESMSEGYELAMRLVGHLLSLEADEIDAIEVHFEDVSSRSLSQIADAIQKLDTVVPGNLARLVSLLPGFTQNDAALAAERTERQLAIEQAATQPAIESGMSPDAALTAQSNALGQLIRAGVKPEEAARIVGLAGINFIPEFTPITVRIPGDETTPPSLDGSAS